jgi:hypothetical protein
LCRQKSDNPDVIRASLKEHIVEPRVVVDDDVEAVQVEAPFLDVDVGQVGWVAQVALQGSLEILSGFRQRFGVGLESIL